MFLFALSICCFVSCQGVVDSGEGTDDGGNVNQDDVELIGKITLHTDRDVIKADGEYVARLSVTLMDNRGVEHDVTSKVEIYCEGMDEPVTDPDFTTTEVGEYVFYALYGFEMSDRVKVRAVEGVADLPADPDPASLSFAHRMLLVQHTGNKCPNCPKLMNILRRIGGDDEYNQLYHHVASHSYNTDDNAFSSAAQTLSKENNVLGFYPMLSYNLDRNSSNESELAYEMMESTIREHIMELHKDVADAGISASATHVGNSVYANISLKTGVTSRYRVAVWLLEDNIHSPQSGADADWQHMHDNCLRMMCGGTKNECIYGRHIGTVEAGQEFDFIAAIDLEDGWKAENCELLIIAVSGTGNYDLVNCTVCPVGDSVPYHY